jgi:UDP-glucose 4-epimerase
VSGKEEFPPQYGPAKPGEQMRSCVDPTKSIRVLGWQPAVDLNTGLEKTFQFFAVP